MTGTWTIKSLLRVTADYLEKKRIESPRLTSEVLLAHQLGVDRVYLYINFDRPLNQVEISGYRALIKRRLGREPLQYITGVQEFWSLEFAVDNRALIPRPETELLVETCLDRVRTGSLSEGRSPGILDLGTGSGVLAICLAKEIPEARIWASDVSKDALDLARQNAKTHGVLERIEFRQGDLWEPMRGQNVSFDMILSNPPYVASEDYNELPPEVLNHEPRTALDGDLDGMKYLEKIIAGSVGFLEPGGWVMMEMAPDQTARALDLIDGIDDYGERSRIKDYSHRHRVVVARKLPPQRPPSAGVAERDA